MPTEVHGLFREKAVETEASIPILLKFQMDNLK
jgi:hypothetical protein